jgi:hypothetical protein
MNKTIERLIAIGMIAVLATTFSYQVAFGANESLDPNNYQAGYQYGMNDWNQHTTNKVGGYECPLSNTAPHSNFCKGYDAALMYENSDQ